MASSVEIISLPRSQETIDVQAVTVGGATVYVAIRYTDGMAASHAVAFAPAGSVVPGAKVSTINVTTGTLAAGNITGAQDVTLFSSNATPGSQAVRSAAAMLTDIGGGVGAGFAFNLRIVNTGAGVFTLATDAGTTVTMTGTMTVAQNTFRDFVVKFDTATTATITSVGKGTQD